jgi:Helix-turn-helix domain
MMPRKVMHFLGTDPPLPDDDLAARVRAARAYANMTRRELAGATTHSDVTEHTVARFEDPDGTSPSRGQISSIARACGLPVGFFVIDLQALDEAGKLPRR